MRLSVLDFKSLRVKLFLGICLIVLPLLALSIVNNFYSVYVVKKQVVLSNQNMIRLYMGQIDERLHEVDNFLSDLSNDEDILSLELPSSLNFDDYMESKIRLFNHLVNNVNSYPYLDDFFVYSMPNDDLMTVSSSDNTTNIPAIQTQIREMLKKGTSNYQNDQWYIWKGKNQFYLFHIIKVEEVYVGAWVDVTKFMIPFQSLEGKSAGYEFLTTDHNQPMNNSDFVKEHHILLTNFAKKSPYLMTGTKSNEGNFNLVLAIPEKRILEELPYLRTLLILFTIFSCLFLTNFFVYMNKTFLLPIRRLINAMEGLRKGKINPKIKPYKISTEFQILNDSFNRMSHEIHHLTIGVYEEKLRAQQAELKHLQLQINPHFFLNSLNIIYSLATVKDFALIQEMTRCLVDYFRFMFRSNSNFVCLKDELHHTENYLRIQQLRFPDQLIYNMVVDEDLMQIQIPPLLIQSMVENSIKYGMNAEYNTEISISIQKLSHDRIHILIEDNGPGFSQEILDILEQNREDSLEEQHHIGIANAIRRLRYLYGRGASISFYNREGKEAVVDIKLPNENKLESREK